MSDEYDTTEDQSFEVDPKALRRFVFEEGWYDAEVVGCRKQESRFGDSQQEILWSFTVHNPGGEGDGHTVHESTSIGKGKGEQFYKFAVGLGLMPSGDAPAFFNPRDAVGTKCKIHVKRRSYKDRTTKETKFANNVSQVAQS